MVKQLLTEKQWHRLEKKGELDFSISRTGLGRFRINAYRQRGSYGLAIRALAVRIPSMEELKLPMILKDLAMKQRGLILVTGPTGSGKSTTLASVIDYINMQRSCHILTLEDPIEYLHRHNLSMVNQREMGHDSFDFANALRAALRQDPDVILVGEMRDLETIAIAVTAAETGHLVLSTLHTVGAAKTIDRVIDVFPPHQQQQIRVQLASELEGVISQQLLPTADGVGRVAAFEVMTATPAIRNLIRENKTHQIQSVIQTGTKFGMKTMDSSLIELYKNGIVTQEMALDYSVDREYMEKTIGSSFY
jgi:twitching motility protein PilT